VIDGHDDTEQDDTEWSGFKDRVFDLVLDRLADETWRGTDEVTKDYGLDFDGNVCESYRSDRRGYAFVHERPTADVITVYLHDVARHIYDLVHLGLELEEDGGAYLCLTSEPPPTPEEEEQERREKLAREAEEALFLSDPKVVEALLRHDPNVLRWVEVPHEPPAEER
jgi:hypothetical protein